MEHGPEGPSAADADPERQDAHVLDARVGQHPLVVGLRGQEHGRNAHREEPEDDEKRPREIAQPGRLAHLHATKDPQKRAVEERTGKERRHGGGYRNVSPRIAARHAATMSRSAPDLST